MKPVRVLFVDDEPNIVLTMPQILRQDGYEVAVADTVGDALSLIASMQFDVLLCDLHINRQDDGIAVINAMRRTQPSSLILILTGFPGFDTAVEAMHNQVDEYLVKPVPLPTLVNLIERRLSERRSGQPQRKRIAELLSANLFDVMHRLLRSMREDLRLNALPLNDEQRIEYTAQLVEYMAEMLEAADPTEIEQSILRQAERQGIRRYRQGYTVPLVAAYARHLERAVLDMLHEHIADIDPAHLLFDLKRLQSSLGMQLEHTLQAYLEAAQQGSESSEARPTA